MDLIATSTTRDENGERRSRQLVPFFSLTIYKSADCFMDK